MREGGQTIRSTLYMLAMALCLVLAGCGNFDPYYYDDAIYEGSYGDPFFDDYYGNDPGYWRPYGIYSPYGGSRFIYSDDSNDNRPGYWAGPGAGNNRANNRQRPPYMMRHSTQPRPGYANRPRPRAQRQMPGRSAQSRPRSRPTMQRRSAPNRARPASRSRPSAKRGSSRRGSARGGGRRR